MKQLVRKLLVGVVDVIVGVKRSLVEGEAGLLAGSLAFATCVSLVPLLTVSLSVFHAYGGFEPLLKRIEPFLLENLVAGAGADITQAIRSALRRVHSRTLGIGAALGLLLASTKLFLDIETAVQRIWGLKTKRPIWLRILVYWALMFVGPLLLAVALGLIGSRDVGLLAHLPKGTIGFIFTFLAFVGIYKFVPACNVSFRASFWSALIAACAVVAAQEFYVILTRKILRYSKLYGSLASVPIFLIWILWLWWICLVGVATSKTLQTRFREPEW